MLLDEVRELICFRHGRTSDICKCNLVQQGNQRVAGSEGPEPTVRSRAPGVTMNPPGRGVVHRRDLGEATAAPLLVMSGKCPHGMRRRAAGVRVQLRRLQLVGRRQNVRLEGWELTQGGR